MPDQWAVKLALIRVLPVLNSFKEVEMSSRVTQLRRRSSEQGLTLMECLVAIVVIEIVIAMIAPPILLSAATRFQNQRVEQATQLAQGEIDRIRLLVERGQYLTTQLPPVSAQTPIQNTAAPSINNNAATRTANQGFSIDVNRDGTSDFVVQTFREQGRSVNNSPIAFRMGVRVYSFRAFANAANPTLQTEPLRLGFTSSENLQRPLAVFYTPIVRSDRDFSLCEYRRFLNSAASCPQ